MPRTLMLWSTLALLAALTACTQPEPTATVVGADRDTHGCIPSAGYTWCARTARCERPWEVAQANGFEPGAANFEQFCSGRGAR